MGGAAGGRARTGGAKTTSSVPRGDKNRIRPPTPNGGAETNQKEHERGKRFPYLGDTRGTSAGTLKRGTAAVLGWLS